jgi:hypothetical protein
MADNRCTAINATKGNRCASKPSNPWGTCRRHQPQAPADAEYAAALQIIDSFQPFWVRPSPAALRALSVEELELLWMEAIAALLDYPELAKHTSMYHLSVFLKIENDFTKRVSAVLTHNSQTRCDALFIREAQDEKRLWLELEKPLADTLQGLQEQATHYGYLYSEVESADMGAGYQMWQILAFEKIAARNIAIKEKMAALSA